MAKRNNRLKSIQHEIRQLDMLKELEPNTTPTHLRPYSEALVEIAQEALNEVARVEDGDMPQLKRLSRLFELVNSLADKAQS